jgi:hypothetical protein
MTKTPSNSTTTGISIMPLVETFGFSRNLHDGAMNRASRVSSVQEWVSTYELEISKSFTVPLAVHTVPEKSIRAQTRVSKVVARVPVAALWLLVLANLAFVVLAIIIAGMALKTAGGDAQQVCLRLSVSGLVAALFEADAGNKVVDGESELFEENERGKLVSTAVLIETNVAGGVGWVARRAAAQVTSSDTSVGYQPLTLTGSGEISRPLLDNEQRQAHVHDT